MSTTEEAGGGYICDSCNGEGEREGPGPGAGATCSACEGTGHHHEECVDCGKLYRYDTGYGARCAPCYGKAFGRPEPREYDEDLDPRRDDNEPPF